MPSDEKNSPAAVPLKDPVANVKAVDVLCQDLYSTGDPEVARHLAFEAGQLEAFFASIRSKAEDVVDRSEAMSALRALVPPVVPHQGTGAKHSAQEKGLVKRTLAQREVGEEAYRSILGLNETEESSREERTSPSDKSNELDLDRFFTNVSRSVVDAQRQLDVTSMQYSREQANSPVPPAFYTIPTVHAEIKAGLSSVDGNGILVRLINDQSQSSFTESTISFDIVSSSPPPGALGKFTAGIPRFLAVEGPDWERVMDGIAAVKPALPGGWQERTIIVRDLDPILARLKKSVILAFVFGPIALPPEGSVTDYSGATLTVYKLTDGGGPVPVAPMQLTAEVVRALSSAASWLASTTVR